MADTRLDGITLQTNRIGPIEVPPARPAVTNDTLRAPATEDRLQFTRQTRVPFLQKYFEENTAGAPLDITTGLSSYDRFQLGLHRTEDDQRRYLEGKYGEGSTRKATDGQWIVRAQGAGGPVDLVADPLGVDAGDWSELASSAPEIAGSFIGMGAGRILPMVGKVKGFLGGFRDVVSSATGAQAAGAIKDIATRVSEGAPSDLPEIARERAVSGAWDTLIGGTIGTGLGIARFIRSPYARQRTDIQINALRAQREIADKQGIYIPLTPAEMTGHPTLVKREAFTSQVPGGSTTLQAFRQRQQSAMNLFQEIMVGMRNPEADVIGRQAIQALRMTTGATDATVDAARLNLSKTALEELEGIAAAQSLPERNISQIFTGDALRNRFTALNDERHAISRVKYNKVRELGGDQAILPGDDLADDIKKLHASLPRRFRSQEEAAGDVLGAEWELGMAVESVEELEKMAHAQRTVTGHPTSIAFVPAGIRSMVGELEAGKGNLWKLTELQQMRRNVYDDIGKANALPDTNAHYLNAIGEALTKAMNEGVEKLPDGVLKDAWREANKDYVENVLPFGKRGIAEMFLKDSDVGYTGSAVLASHYTSGAAAADRWRVVKEFIGSDSIEGRAIKRMAFDRVIGKAVDPTTGLVNGKELMNNLASFKESSLDFYNEMFGRAADDIQRVAKFVVASDKDVLPVKEVETMLRTGRGITVTALRALKEAERKESEIYSNSILEGIKAGKWDTSKIKPDEFVARFANKASVPEIKQVQEILARDRPALLEDIRASALADIFRQHRGKATGISDALEAANRDKVTRTLLGDELFTDLKRYGALEKAILTNREKSIAGSLAAGKRVDMIFLAPLRFAIDTAREKTTALLLASSSMRRWALSQSEPSEAITTMLMASPEFLRGVAASFGDDAEGFRQAETFLGSTRRAINESWAQQQGRESRTPPSRTTNAPTRLSPPTLMLR